MIAYRTAASLVVFSAFLTLPGPVAQADFSLLVTNAGTNQVLRFDAATGAARGVFAQDTGTVSGLAYGPDQNLYVSNLESWTVEQFNGATGSFIKTFIPTSGGLIFPHDLTFGPDGNLYVASGETDSVRQYDGTSGAFLSTFASGDGLSKPTGLAFFGGKLYVSSSSNSLILEFNGTTGAFLRTFASGNGLNGPAGLAFDAAGNLYVANFSGDNVLKFDGHGRFVGTFASGSGLSGPGGVALGPDGNLFVTSFFSNAVLEFDGSTGAFLQTFATGDGLNQPTHLLFKTVAVPEPASVALLGGEILGLVVVNAWRRSRRARAATQE